MTNTDWLANLKPGDKVIRTDKGDGFQHWPDIKTTVKKLTKTMIILNDDSRFSIKSGNQVAAGYHPNYISEWTEEKETQIKLDHEKIRLFRYLRDITWRDHNLETLRKVAAILKEEKE